MRFRTFLIILLCSSSWNLCAQNSNLKLVLKNDKYGFEKNGKLVIPALYDSAYNFNEGSAAVKQKGRWFYINEDGTFYHDEENGNHDTLPTFKMARPYYNGLAVVLIDYSAYPDVQSGMEIIGQNGYTASDYHHYEPMDSIGDFKDGYSLIKDSEKYGVMDKNYHLVLPVSFDKIDSFSNGWSKVTYEGRTITLDPLGQCHSNCLHGYPLPRKATADYRTILIAYGGNPILSRAKFQLHSLIKDLQKQQDKKVFIVSNGNSSYMAMQRSWEGADAVANYLENAGIERSRMIMEYGRDGRYGTVNIQLVDLSVMGPSRLPTPHPVNIQRQ